MINNHSVVYSKCEDKKYSSIVPFIGNSYFVSGIALYRVLYFFEANRRCRFMRRRR